MTNAIEDVRTFMVACGQSVEGHNVGQADLYDKLTAEETNELREAREAEDEVAEFDACMDLVWVILGYCFSRGWPVHDGWNAVAGANHAKVDPLTGQVRRRADGKILKPEGWVAPDERIRALLAARAA